MKYGSRIFYVNRGVDMGEVPYVVVVRKYVENNSFFKKILDEWRLTYEVKVVILSVDFVFF